MIQPDTRCCPRPYDRGNAFSMARPTMREIFAYRAHVDEAMQRLIVRVAGDASHPVARLVELGLHHE